mgnify:CR=1 FL=1
MKTIYIHGQSLNQWPNVVCGPVFYPSATASNYIFAFRESDIEEPDAVPTIPPAHMGLCGGSQQDEESHPENA